MHCNFIYKLVLFSFGLLALPLATAYAQVPYSVTPRVIDITAEARDIVTRQITITNNHPTAFTTIFPSVNEISVDAGGDITEFRGPTQVDRTAAITSWIELPRREVRIPPGESQDITVTVRMNPNTKPGEYHALLGFGSGRIRDDAEAQVKAGRAPSIVLTVRVADTKVERMDLEGFVVDRFVLSADNQAAHYTLTNPGDTEIIPTGEIIFYDSRGEELGSTNANPNRIALAPGEEVKLDTPVPIEGLGGRHKAFLNINYGVASAAAVYDTAFFYVVPWQKLVLLFALVAIFAVILTVYLYKRYGIDDDDADRLDFHIRESTSEAHEKDIDLKQNR